MSVCWLFACLFVYLFVCLLSLVGSVLVVAPQTHPPPPKVYESPILILVLSYTSEGGGAGGPPPKVYESLLY